MTLGDYLASEKLTHEAFARLVNASPWGVGKWARGERIPRPKQIAAIREATAGKVSFDDFVPAKSGAAA